MQALIKKLIYLLACLVTTAVFNSCGNDDDNPFTGSTSGEVFATVESFAPDHVFFSVYRPGPTEYLFTYGCDRSPIITEEEYPVGTRVFIAYTMTGIQLTDPLRIRLNNISKVNTVNLKSAGPDQCKLDYPPIALGSNAYVSGGYINFVANVQQAASRTWNVLLDTETSTDDVAHVYILTEAVDARPQRINLPVSVALNTFKPQYKYIILHYKTENNNDYTLSLQIPIKP